MNRFVMVYLVKGQFHGRTTATYAKWPTVGARHAALLFIAQNNAEADVERARQVFDSHGWCMLKVEGIRPIKPEALNDQSMEVFREHYENCFRDGDSLIWYRDELTDADIAPTSTKTE